MLPPGVGCLWLDASRFVASSDRGARLGARATIAASTDGITEMMNERIGAGLIEK